MSTTKKIMVIESRILIDGVVISEHSSHKVAIAEAKKLKEKAEYSDRDILLFAPNKKANYSPKAYRYHNQGFVEKPINLSEKGNSKNTLKKMEDKLAAAKAEFDKLFLTKSA